MSNNFLKGLIEIAGPHDSGKSSEATSYYDGNPQDVAFIDNDLKGESTANQMQNDNFPFGIYIDLRKEASKKDWEKYFSIVENTIDILEERKPKIVIWDTWPDVYTACKAHIIPRADIYNKVYGGTWSGNSQIRNGEWSREARRVEGWLITRVLSFAETFIITSHLKGHYLTNPATGRGEPTGKDIQRSSNTIAEMARLRLWLIRTGKSRIPAALTIKNIDKKVYIEGVGVRTKDVLPFKIVPNIKLPCETEEPNDLCLWDTIKRYWQCPVGQREFLKDEIPNEEEKSIIDGTLTREQKIMWLASVKRGEEMLREEAILFEQENKQTAIDLFNNGNGLSIAEIATQLKTEKDVIMNWVL